MQAQAVQKRGCIHHVDVGEHLPCSGECNRTRTMHLYTAKLK